MSERWWVLRGDCKEVLKECQDSFFDAMVTDPPAGVSFMGREWDSDKGGRDQWIKWLTEVMKECYRVLKPRAHAFVWALPRTSSWTCRALEDAGFEVHHIVHHHFGNGFPKSQDVGKFIDRLAGAEREVVGINPSAKRLKAGKGISGLSQVGCPTGEYEGERLDLPITAPVTEEAKTWDGWGTALKPATEHWILARKPLSESSVARNVLKWGTGALNIDACRVHRASNDVPGWHKSGANGVAGYRSDVCPYCDGEGRAKRFTDGSPMDEPVDDCFYCKGTGQRPGAFAIREMSPEEIQERCGDKGRWPPDLILSHAPDCGIECVEGCPVAELDRQSGTSRSRKGKPRRSAIPGDGYGMVHTGSEYDDRGGASRFFPVFHYFPKPSRSEREAGCDDLPSRILNRVNPGGLENEPRWAPQSVKNNHPTVKGIALMTWLIQLITPPEVVEYYCEHCDKTVSGVRSTISAKAQRSDRLFDQMSKSDCGEGRSDSTPTNLSVVRQGVSSSECGGEVLLDPVSGGDAKEAGIDLPDVPSPISSSIARRETEKVLFPEVCVASPEDTAPEAMRVVSNDIPTTARRRASILLSGVCGQGDGDETTKDDRNHDQGICDAVPTGTPDDNEIGLRHGTSSRHGGASRSPANVIGGGPSSQRDKERQSFGESRTDVEARSRPANEATPETQNDHMPALWRTDHDSCPRCKGPITERRRSGIILDPFCGSGSTGAAAVKNGFRFVGIDQSEEYCQIARARIRYWDVRRQCET